MLMFLELKDKRYINGKKYLNLENKKYYNYYDLFRFEFKGLSKLVEKIYDREILKQRLDRIKKGV